MSAFHELFTYGPGIGSSRPGLTPDGLWRWYRYETRQPLTPGELHELARRRGWDYHTELRAWRQISECLRAQLEGGVRR